jgi:hypothetical protein
MDESDYNRAVRLLIKAPQKVTDRQLAQIRRSSRTGAEVLYQAVREQWRRDLLSRPRGKRYVDGPGSANGYWRETLKRVSDYPEDQISPRFW